MVRLAIIFWVDWGFWVRVPGPPLTGGGHDHENLFWDDTLCKKCISLRYLHLAMVTRNARLIQRKWPECGLRLIIKWCVLWLINTLSPPPLLSLPNLPRKKNTDCQLLDHSTLEVSTITNINKDRVATVSSHVLSKLFTGWTIKSELRYTECFFFIIIMPSLCKLIVIL